MQSSLLLPTTNLIGFLSYAKQEDMTDVAGLALLEGCVVRRKNVWTVWSRQMLEELSRFVAQRELYPLSREDLWIQLRGSHHSLRLSPEWEPYLKGLYQLEQGCILSLMSRLIRW